MKRYLITLLCSLIGVLALASTAGACAFWGYQARMPRSLRP